MFLKKIVVVLSVTFSVMLLLPKDVTATFNLLPQEMREAVYRATTTSVPALEQEDPYLQSIYENGEILGCYTDDGFAKLTSGAPVEQLVGLCLPEPVESQPTRLGYVFFDEPVYDSVEMFVHGSFYDPSVHIAPSNRIIAVKYVMETEHGQVKFVWPYPLDEADYALFTGPFEEDVEVGAEPDLLPGPPVLLGASF